MVETLVADKKAAPVSPVVPGKPRVEHYDLIIIGSSPMSLVEASVRAGKGDRVLIVEAGSGLGGAWGVEDCFGIPNIETSPHVFMPDQAANDIMKKFLPSTYEDLPVQPRLLIRTSKRYGDFYTIAMNQRYREAWVLNHIDKFENGKGSAWSRRWDAVTSAIETMKYRKRNKQNVNLIYPKFGLRQWLLDIEKHLTAKKVTIKRNTKITDLIVEKGKIRLIDSHGVHYTQGKLAYSEMFQVDRFVYEGQPVPLSYEEDSSQHIVFIVKGVSPLEKLPFWRLMKDGYFMFFNDITRYSKEFQDQYPGHRLISTRLYSYRMFVPSMIKTYFAHLSYVGYLKAEAEMVDWHYRYYVRRKMTYAERYRLKKMLGNAAYELVSGTVGLHNGLRSHYSKYLAE